MNTIMKYFMAFLILLDETKMKSAIAISIMFVLGFLSLWLTSTPDPGYERLWFVSAIIGGVIFTIPVFVFLFIRAVLSVVSSEKEDDSK